MGLNAREKTLRPGAVGRKRHVPRPSVSQMAFPSEPSLVSASPYPNAKLNPGSNASPNPSPAGFDWGYCTEEQLEEIVINNLDCVYKEAISRLVSLGYDETLALRSVLCNGHCYGAMDAVSNIMQNALAYLNTEAAAAAAGDGDPPAGAFSDLRHLEEYSLAGMVCLLQQIRPDLSRGEAMWCLLMSGLHVNRASSIELPSLSVPGNLQASAFMSGAAFPFAAGGGDAVTDSTGTEPDSAIAAGSHSSESNKHSFLSQPVNEYCPELKTHGKQRQQMVEDETGDLVQLVLKRLESMRIEDDKYQDKELQDQKKEMIMELIQQIRELEGQIKERKDWAQQKAIQAAQKLSSDLHELRVLKLEREENQRAMTGKQVLEDSTMKRLADMENALKKASGQVDRANAVVKNLETENAEIRAEMVASKLSASESVTACLEVTKRERKCLKKLVAWEKQKEKMQEEISEKRKKIVLMQQHLAEAQADTKQLERKWREAGKEREEAQAGVEEERRMRDATEESCRRRQEGLRHRMEEDSRRYRDDIRRLEEELSRLRGAATPAKLPPSLATAVAHPPLASRKGGKRSRSCWVCKHHDASVVLLPCAHQVLCLRCSESHRDKPSCPACRMPVDDRIHVYGAATS